MQVTKAVNNLGVHDDLGKSSTSGSWNGTFAIVLAAGFSTRMGTCKADLPWQGTTLLAYQCSQFLAIGITPIVVLGTHNFHCKNDCPDGCIIVINLHPEQGKISSILRGLQVLSTEFAALILSAVDQPRPTAVYKTLLQSHVYRNASITAPTFQNKLGHPLVFAPDLLPNLLAIREETLGIRHLVQLFDRHICRVEFDASVVLLDLNTPELYQQQLQQQNNYSSSLTGGESDEYLRQVIG